MILCKIANNSEDSCGKNCCCLVCDEAGKCDMICEYVHNKSVQEPSECEHAQSADDKLAVIHYQISPIIQTIAGLTEQKKSIETEEKKMRQMLMEAMEKYNIRSFENEHIKLIYVAATTKTTIDTKALKAEMPAVAKKYEKTSNVAASVRITVK